MPAYLVELLDHPGYTLPEGANKIVVFAADVANATAAAQGRFNSPKGADAMWAAATVTEIVNGASVMGEGAELQITIADAAPIIDITARAGPGNDAVASAAVNDGGVATYVIDEILTVIGGTFTRAATFRVITVSTGVILTVEMVDPGEYTVAPSLVANAVTGGGGTGALLDLTMAGENSYEVLMGQIVTLLNLDAQIAGAEVDMSELASGARLLTVSDIADGLGDLTLTVRMGNHGVDQTSLKSTITDGGVSGAVLTMAIPASALPIPNVVSAFRG
jgi:hypothetical protein